MNDQPFHAFINLIEHDQEIRRVRTEISQAEHLLHEFQQQEKKIQEEFEQHKTHVKQLRKNVDVLELEMKELDAKEGTKKHQLEQTSSSKEYQALKKEIAQLKTEQHDKEEILLHHWNQLDGALKELKQQQLHYDQEIAVLHTKMQEQLMVLKGLETDVLAREGAREEKERVVPNEWLEKYRHMRTQTADPVVPVISGSCSACFNIIPEHEQLRLLRKAMVQCKGCFRLMYMQEAWKEQ